VDELWAYCESSQVRSLDALVRMDLRWRCVGADSDCVFLETEKAAMTDLSLLASVLLKVGIETLVLPGVIVLYDYLPDKLGG